MAAIGDGDLLEVVAKRCIDDAAIAIIEIEGPVRHHLIPHTGAKLIGEVPVARIDDRAVAPFQVGADPPDADPTENMRRHAVAAQAGHVEIVDHIAEKGHPRRAAAERVVSAEQVGRNLPTGVLERIRAVVGVIEFALDADITELVAGAGPDVIASAGA